MRSALAQVGSADYRATAPARAPRPLDPDAAERRQAQVDDAFLDSNGLDLLAELRDALAVPKAARPAAAAMFLSAWGLKLRDFEEGYR